MSTTAWYPRYVGDYSRKTAHLSLIEHGAYALLLDWYYSNGKPLPRDIMQVHRICRAFASEEQSAVHSVLQQFFHEEEDGWHNQRADSEIIKKAEVSEKRTKSAKSRWSKSISNCNANADANAHTITTTTTIASREAKGDFQKVFDGITEIFPGLTAKSPAPIHQWLSAGCTPEIILEETGRHRGRDIASFAYFTRGIMDAKATREKPLPEGRPRTGDFDLNHDQRGGITHATNFRNYPTKPAKSSWASAGAALAERYRREAELEEEAEARRTTEPGLCIAENLRQE